jgi:hypothetical protein
MSGKRLTGVILASALGLLLCTVDASAQVSAQDAAQLKTTLTPLGAEKAGNKDGTIPAWDGGLTKPIPGFKQGGRRPDPFANEKPLFSITAKNMDQYADKLTDGTKALFKKYPNTFRVDVYPTHRTEAAPQWVYDNTYRNATRAKLVNGPAGPQPEGAFGGIPFPIPQNGAEVMWNHLLHWRGTSWHWDQHGYLITADGKRVLTVDGSAYQQMPYYIEDASPQKWDGDYWDIHMVDAGPPIRAGEGITGRENINDDRTQSWVYLTGQRRVRHLPNPCCDTPTPASAGIMGFDDLQVFQGRLGRFDWKLLGKKEMYIPYNTNKLWVPTHDSDVLGEHHLNPDYLRWELHRVWIVEATLAKGQRHQVHRGLYYIDEDSWIGIFADRWDAAGRLWKIDWNLVVVGPDLPGVFDQTHGFYDLVAGSWYANCMENEKSEQYRLVNRYPDSVFTPDAMAGEGVR